MGRRVQHDRNRILAALRESRWRAADAAQRVGCSRRTVERVARAAVRRKAPGGAQSLVLDDRAVALIRRWFGEATGPELARRFGVSPKTIYRVVA